MNKIGIILKLDSPEAETALEKLIPWLADQKKKVLVIDPKKSKRVPSVDMMIVLGGDGTLLYVARWMAGSAIPVLAVNLGHLGFLTEVTLDNLYSNLTPVLNNEYLNDPRSMLQCEILQGKKKVHTATVLNDIAVNKGSFARLIKMEILVEGQFVTALRGDGLIISSATGSTAYTLSSGGPIVHPSVDALILTPISPHILTNRPIVIPASACVQVILKSKETGPVVTFDGQEVAPLQMGDHVCVKRSAYPLNLIRSPHQNYYQTLREKLQWGSGAG
jgi:NAD+ kinase